MADKTGISWTDATWNPCVGCSIKSPGCRLCYAMREAHRMGENPKLLGKYQGLTEVASNGRPVWNGVVRLHEAALDKPLHWARPRLIFVNSMSDLFHESLGVGDIDKIMATMVLAYWHIFQVLTKRSAIMRAYMNDPETPARVTREIVRRESAAGKTAPACFSVSWPPPNVHMGVSAERQPEADERVFDLMRTKAAVRWISGEPLIGPIDLTRIRALVGGFAVNALTGNIVAERSGEVVPLDRTEKLRGDGGPWGRIDGVVTGGESDDGLDGIAAAPSHPDWHQSIADQCETHGVGYHFKQWGSWLPLRTGERPPVRARAARDIGGGWIAHHVGKKNAGHLLHGVAHQNWPKLPEVEA